ncbi:small conductance calcium-activated potassium channel protein 3-like isoform X1 [Haliotis asinina]|uniref:small conductance calcium-activated potassium channel protein 3-like isoform X1 n=2 Tax=Haliotis asinina TaxID=109174 RepID=UPI0035325755
MSRNRERCSVGWLAATRTRAIVTWYGYHRTSKRVLRVTTSKRHGMDIRLDVMPKDMNDDNPSTPLVSDKSNSYKYMEENSGTSSASAPKPETEKRERNLGWRLELRKKLILRRRWLVDIKFVMAMSGILFMVVENELYYSNMYEKGTAVSIVLKSLTSISTLVLLVAICMYYHTGMEIRMVDGGVDDPLVVTPVYTWVMLVAELLVCAVHPFPGDIRISMDSLRGIKTSSSIDGILSVLMMFRLYIVGKFMVVHSRLLTDPSTQSIGAVSTVRINPFFVFKCAMNNHPGLVITFIMLTMYTVSVWGMRTCELYYTQTTEVASFTESMWLSAITFLTVGYGDLTPSTHCGRFIAVVTGLMGLGSTALLVAVIARRLEQSRSERYVYNFLTRIHLENKRKNAAADVVKLIIRIWIRKRHFNTAISTFTLLNWKLRNAVRTMRLARASLAEIDGTSISLIEISQVMTRVNGVVDAMLSSQNQVCRRLRLIESQLAKMQTAMGVETHEKPAKELRRSKTQE